MGKAESKGKNTGTIISLSVNLALVSLYQGTETL